MASDESPFAIARHSLDDTPGDGGIDPRLAEALINAIVDYPTFQTACAACGVTSRSVEGMLERGAQVGAPRSLREFAKRLARADADNARMHYQVAQQCIARGMAAEASLAMKLLDRRWSAETGNDIMAMLTRGKRTTNLKARLEQPSAMLGALLVSLLKKPNAIWETLLKGAGWVRAIPETADPDPEDSEPPEPEEEQEDDGDPAG